MRTLADKRRSTFKKVAKSLKKGPNHYAVTLEKRDGTIKEYRLVSSTTQLQRKRISYQESLDRIPSTWQFRSKTELGQRLRASECEWCGTREEPFEVHHIRRLEDLQEKTVWERHMIARRRKTLVLCKKCHVDLHAGRLSETTKRLRENWRAGYA